MINILAVLLVIILGLWIGHSLILNRRLHKSKQQYLQIFDTSPVALIVIDRNHRILEWNKTAKTIFGWESDKIRGANIIDLLVPEFDQIHVASVLQKASADGVSFSKNYNITQNGTELFCEWRNRLLEGRNGDILCMAQDITLTQKTLDDLSKRSTALESAGDAILYTNAQGIIEFANQSFFALKLTDQDKVYDSHIGIYLFKDKSVFNTVISQFNANNSWRGTITKPSGKTTKVLSITLTAIYLRNRLVSYVANLHDITQISTHMDHLAHCAQHDPLTGAVNRATLRDRLNLAISRSNRNAQKIALYFIDLNDFKLINDVHGHEAGDKLLQSITINLIACLRNTDTVCRYGGDEFVILVEDIKSEEQIHSVLETIQTAINEPIRIDSSLTLIAKASIGISLYPDHATDADGLLKAADIQMYIRKREKNTNEPEPKLSAHIHNR